MNTGLKRDLLDDDCENQAVRMFLALYETSNGVSVKQMRDHLRASGFPCWPEWAAEIDEYLTKDRAQAWLRHLFSLEAQPVSGAVDEPLEVFDKGPWRWEETGQLFSGEELDTAAFSVYRAHLQRYDVREKALNALLWFYRRAKPTYGRLPFAEEAIAALSHPAAAPVSEQTKGNQT